MDPDDHDDLTLLFLNCHESVREIIKESTGEYPKEYKRFEKKRIDKIFRNIQYKGRNILDFTALLMSDLIVTHGLSNTNHRTMIMFISILQRKLEIDFPFYDSEKEMKRWIEDCNRYITGSKEILHMRKNDPDYGKRHLNLTREWLKEVIGDQSSSSGMMSLHRLNSLRKMSSSDFFPSVIIKNQ